jgi:hypothetical protein
VSVSTRDDFFVQEHSRAPWHVESEDDCERMLCGHWVSVDNASARVQTRWGPKRCPDCYVLLLARNALRR